MSLTKIKYRIVTMILVFGIVSSFSFMNVTAENVVAKYMHSWFFNESNKQKPSVESDGKTIFEYLGGYEGEYKPLNEYQSDWSAWTMSKAPPSIASWYVGSTTGNDGVIAFNANESADIIITSSVNVKIDDYMADKCDGVGLMIVQENKSGFYPLWPQKGKFEWTDVKAKGEFKLPPINTAVKAGERILFIVHSSGSPTGDTVVIDPVVEVLDSTSFSHPDGFVKWPKSGGEPTTPNQPTPPSENETIFKHSAYYSSTDASNPPFSYKGGYNGEYNLLNTYREDWGGWTYGGSPPTIGSYYMCGTVENDAVIVYTAQKSGLVKAYSEVPVKLQFGDQSDGSAVIVVLKNENGEHPIWPKLGEWAYQPITSATNLEMKDISVYMRKGDELHFISRSTGTSDYDTIEIAPVIEIDVKAPEQELLPHVERVFPTYEDFIANLPNITHLSIDKPAGTKPALADDIVVKNENNSKIIIIIVIAFAVVLIGVAILIIVLKKRGGNRKNET